MAGTLTLHSISQHSRQSKNAPTIDYANCDDVSDVKATNRSPCCFQTDIDFVMPDSASMGLCSDFMSYNGDFQTGTAEGWQFMWFGSDIVQEQETNSTNYYMRTKNRQLSRSNVYTLLDRSCLKKGERYQLKVKIRIQNNGNEKSCGVSHSLYCSLYRCAQILILIIIFLLFVPAG